MRLWQRKHLVATSCHVEIQLDLTSLTTDLDQSFWNYGSPSVVRVLVRNSREFPDVVRKTEVEDGISC